VIWFSLLLTHKGASFTKVQ